MRKVSSFSKAHKAARDDFRPSWERFCDDTDSFEGKSVQPAKFLEHLDKYRTPQPSEAERRLDEEVRRMREGRA